MLNSDLVSFVGDHADLDPMTRMVPRVDIQPVRTLVSWADAALVRWVELHADELARSRSIPPYDVAVNDDDRRHAVAGAVRAEMARAQKRSSELVDVLRLSKPTIWGRMKGAYPFTLAELDKVADFLGITTQGILDSAALGESLRDGGPKSIPSRAVSSDGDAWAQPPGSFRRRASQTG
jgi:hypothetical protein